MRKLLVALILSAGYGVILGCAAIPLTDSAKAPQAAWDRLARGEAQDLIVVFDDAAIQEAAARLRKDSGDPASEAAIIRFKAEQFAALKKATLAAMPGGEIEILKDYDVLPIMFLRLHTRAALQALLAQPSFLRAYEDRQESLLPRNSGR